MNRALYAAGFKRHARRCSTTDAAIALIGPHGRVSIQVYAQARSSSDVPQHSPALDESELIRAVQRGEAGALRALLDRYCHKAYLLAYRRLGEARDAETAVERTFVEVVKTTVRFSGPDEFATLLFSIVRKYAPFRPAPVAPGAPESRGHGYGIPVRAHGRSHDRSEILALFRSVLANRTPQARLAVELHAIDGVSIAEVATMLGLTVSTARTHVENGHVALCNALIRAGQHSTSR